MPERFPPSLLQRLTGAYSIKIETRDRADAPWHRTTVWVAVDQATGAVYVRSVRGPRGNWYRRLLANPEGGLAVSDERVDVKAVPATADEITLVSDLFRHKYANDQHMLAIQRPDVLPATFQLVPAAV
jgi:hypothetical protein